MAYKQEMLFTEFLLRKITFFSLNRLSQIRGTFILFFIRACVALSLSLNKDTVS